MILRFEKISWSQGNCLPIKGTVLRKHARYHPQQHRALERLYTLQVKRSLSIFFLIWMSCHVGIAYLFKIRPPHLEQLLSLSPTRADWLYHCGVSDNSGRIGVAIVMSENSVRHDWVETDKPTYCLCLLRRKALSVYMLQHYAPIATSRISSMFDC